MPGYISLHRDIQKHWLYEEERVFSRYEAWLDIMMRVNHAEGKVTHNGTVETVPRGSTIWSMGDMEKHWGWSNKKVKRFLLCLERDQMLSVKSTTKKTYLTVINYDKYQGSDVDKAPPMHQQSTTEAFQKHTNNNELIMTNNDKEEKKKSTSRKQVYDENSSPYKLAVYLYSKISDWTDQVNTPNMQTWADECRLLLEKDKRDKQLVKDVIDWATKDDFWQSNILSPKSLRKQFPRLSIALTKSLTISGSNVTPFPKGGQNHGESVRQGSTAFYDQQAKGEAARVLPSKWAGVAAEM